MLYLSLVPAGVWVLNSSNKSFLNTLRSSFLIAACREPSRADELQALAKGNGNLKIIKMDVTKDEDIASAFEQTTKILGNRGLNLLINNAAIHSKVDTGFLETQTRERMQSHFDTNVTGK